jgi:hypothetical protein
MYTFNTMNRDIDLGTQVPIRSVYDIPGNLHSLWLDFRVILPQHKTGVSA